MLFTIYCPCKVKEIGTDVVGRHTFGAATVHYLVYLDIRNKQDRLGFARCRHCNAFLKLGNAKPRSERSVMTTIAAILFALALACVAWSLRLLSQVERLCDEGKARLEAEIQERKDRDGN